MAANKIYDQICDRENGRLVLTNSESKHLLIEDDDEQAEEWIADMIVSCQITGWTPPTLNEVRALNNAPPVPDGDVPWTPCGDHTTKSESA